MKEQCDMPAVNVQFPLGFADEQLRATLARRSPGVHVGKNNYSK